MKTNFKASPIIGVTGYLEHTWNVDRTEILCTGRSRTEVMIGRHAESVPDSGG